MGALLQLLRGVQWRPAAPVRGDNQGQADSVRGTWWGPAQGARGAGVGLLYL